jgi:phosphoglycerate-specific signal transduction histidine kinase
MGNEAARAAHLKFVGKVLSVFTHEINNHLAILKESAGLIEDTLRFQKNASGDVMNIVQSIEKQIAKTAWLCKKLNGFGHRMDNGAAVFNANECIDELLALLNRLANHRQVCFVKEFKDGLPQAAGDPAMLQLLLFCVIEKGLNDLDRDGRIIFKTAHSGGHISIEIIIEGRLSGSFEKGICPDDIAGYLASRLKGGISYNGGGSVSITLPAPAA